MTEYNKTSRDGYNYKITKIPAYDSEGIRDYNRVVVEYEDGELQTLQRYSVKHNSHKRYHLVRGIGVYDLSERNQTKCPIYQKWVNMLLRVTMNEKGLICNRSESTITSYKDCKVCDEWLVYSNFKNWVLTQDYEGWDLDKDLIGDGTLYSPNTCCFIPHKLNCLLVVQNKGDVGLAGVQLSQNKYQVTPYKDNKRIPNLVKSFYCKYEAHKYWQTIKSQLILEASKEMYDGRYLSNKIVQALQSKADKLILERDSSVITVKI